MHATLPLLKSTDFPAIARRALDTLQVNVGYRCNQACHHCHVNASPDRSEMIDVGLVAGNYFGVLGVQAQLGRLLTPEDNQKRNGIRSRSYSITFGRTVLPLRWILWAPRFA